MAALAVAAIAALTGPAAASAAPENAYSSPPSAFLDINPHDLLPASAPVTATGTGLSANTAGTFVQCTRVGELNTCSASLGPFNTDGSGNFSAPVTVTRTLTPDPPGPAVDCGVVACFLLAEAGASYAGHHLDFAVPPGPLPPPPPSFIPAQVTGLSAFVPTGQRARAEQQCRKRYKGQPKLRYLCLKRARRLPV